MGSASVGYGSGTDYGSPGTAPTTRPRVLLGTLHMELHPP